MFHRDKRDIHQFWGTFLFLVVFLFSKRQSLKVHKSGVITYLGSLQAHDANNIFPSDMRDTVVFNIEGFRDRVMILSI
jgi:hypothetical protein